jgi:hypothetical protein
MVLPITDLIIVQFHILLVKQQFSDNYTEIHPHFLNLPLAKLDFDQFHKVCSKFHEIPVHLFPLVLYNVDII